MAQVIILFRAINEPDDVSLWCMTKPSPVVNTRTMPFDYNTHHGPYSEVGGPLPDVHTSRAPVAYHAPSPTMYGR